MNLGVGIAIILLVSIGGNYILFGRLQDSRASLNQLQESVNSIKKSQTIQQEEIKNLNKKQDSIIATTRAANSLLQKLKGESDEIKAYLSTPVPPDVSRLLNEARLSDQ